MRRAVLGMLSAVLAAVVIARCLLPTEARAQDIPVPDATSRTYNMLTLDLTGGTGTAGSGVIGELSDYFLSCAPTAKSSYTGLWEGMSLVVICAESWEPTLDETAQPALYRLWAEGAHLTEVYAPDWYQGLDGREFSLLTGTLPTSVRGQTALSFLGERGVYLPYSLPTALSAAGYTCLAFSDSGQDDAYLALGFSQVANEPQSPSDMAQTVSAYAGCGTFLAYYVLDGTELGETLEALLTALDEAGRGDDTAICLLTGQETELRGSLYLWGTGLSGSRVDTPCSELDMTPTLLDLLGISYDSRFLSGRDLFAGDTVPGRASAAMPLVSLYGSAYGDWVTDTGCYLAGENIFWLSGDYFVSDQEASRYV